MSIFAVTSGKGGTGKSCVAAYTAAALARSGKNTLLLELGTRSADLVFGLSGEVLHDVSDVAAGRCPAADAIRPVGDGDRLFLLPGSPFSLTPTPGPEIIRELLEGLRGSYHHIMVDGADFSRLPPRVVDTILLVVTPDSLCVRASSRHAAELYGAGAKQMRLIINDVPSQIQPIQGIGDFDDIIDQTGAQLAAVIPHSPKLHYAANSGKPVDRDSITRNVYDHLAARLQGRHRPLLVR